MKNKKNRHRIIWLSVIVLFVLAAATSIVYSLIMNNYLPDDSGAIPLIPETPSQSTEDNTPAESEAPTTETEPEKQEEASAPEKEESSGTDNGDKDGFKKNPSAVVYDDDRVWTTNSKFEVFSISDENGEKKITVQSSDEDKVIAPGTEFSYVFKIKNTGNVALDNEVQVNAYITPDDVIIPITGRLSRYDGKWIAGDRENYAEVDELDLAADVTTIGAGKYAYYVLDWKWPFESGDDELDTMLGDMSVTQEITFTLEVTTYSVESPDPGADGGIGAPQTGDTSNLMLWLSLAIGALFILLILFFIDRKDRNKEEVEETEA